jgi:hypothetical protein
MAPRACRCAAAGLLGMLIVGCGGGSDRGTSPIGADTTATQPDLEPDLEEYLLRAGEVPGLEPVASPRTDSGTPFELTQDGLDLLRRSGYISTTYQPAEGDRGAGVSSVLLFESEAGARDWMAFEISDEVIRLVPDAKIKRFQVPEVPGATGWTGPDLHGNAIGQVYCVQDRCMMLIGLETEGPRVERLSAGVRAIYERTGGICPG